MKKIISILLVLILMLPLAYSYFHETSPIKWREYNQETFDLAKKEDKPVFMLVTAIWCYWCHVYRDETLHDPIVVDYLNKNFIPVFVDADKRQDLTRQYLAGGWPSTVIFSPDGKEVSRINGHIKKQDLLNYLEKIVKFFETNELPQDYKKQELILRTYKVVPGKVELQQLTDNLPFILSQNYDAQYGGFGAGQKFPSAVAWGYMIYAYEKTGNKEFLDAATNTLNHMYNENYIDDWSKPLDLGEFNGVRKYDQERKFQGIYDPIEGGFFRYATRRDWSIPHYEKILDVNAELIRLYLHAYNVTKNPKYKEIADKSLRYVIDNLYDKENGGFYGSQDAGHEIYYRQKPEERFKNSKEPKPRVDKTKYSDLNAPMIATFFYASDILENKTYKDIAIKSTDFFKNEMLTDNGILHFYDDNGAQLNGFLLDNAHMSLAFDEAYKQTGNEEYRKAGLKLLDFSLKRLYDGKTGAFFERNSTDKHFYFGDEYFLSTVPYSGNSVMALALTNAYDLTNDKSYLDVSSTIIGYFIQGIGDFDNAALQALSAESILKNKKDLKQTAEIIESKEEIKISQRLQINWFLFIVAFVVGLLSFLSPCTLPILPAYFAYSFKSERKKIFFNSIAFFIGLALVFSILGMASTLIGSFLRNNSLSISRFLGLIVILFGVIVIFGRGFSGIKIKQKTSNKIFGSFLFGITFGIGWTPCVGPILSSLFIIASQSSTTFTGGILLFLYALGLAIPLILISLFFDRLDQNGRFWRFLQGKEWKVKIFNKEIMLHSTSLISGVLLIIIGLLMTFGYLYAFNQFVRTTSFQKWIFGLEEKLFGLF
ncbi:DUF255 domain-containing protein [Candidatus Woesearchaeota archaeon]|nr:DUF255 domain-containing protein [Candidatus Woesearchaeota archaeon]